MNRKSSPTRIADNMAGQIAGIRFTIKSPPSDSRISASHRMIDELIAVRVLARETWARNPWPSPDEPAHRNLIGMWPYHRLAQCAQ
jgi:hypothetical protein